MFTEQEARRKKERRINIATKTSSLVLCIELMALETPTQIFEVQTTSAPRQSALTTACQALGVHVYCTYQVV
jgi:hypothetical protein